MVSHARAWRSLDAGVVTPSRTAGPSVARSAAAPTSAPPTWAIAYVATLGHGKWRPIAKPIETAGLKWAPETCPSA